MSGTVDFLGKNRSFQFIMIISSTLQKIFYKRAPKMGIGLVHLKYMIWTIFQVLMKLAM